MAHFAPTPPAAAIETVELAPGYRIPRVIRGGWQLASDHGWTPDAARAVAECHAFADAGLTALDCADIYTGVEEIFGRFLAERRMRHGEAVARAIRIHTKCVPDRDRLAELRRADVEATIDRSLGRLGVERLDLVQFHWWNYAVPGAAECLSWLKDLQAAGKIERLGLTNFDTRHVRAFVAAGAPLVSHQVQYSLLDCRPENGMADFCARYRIGLLCYGALAGGFLSERWLGAPDPGRALANRSLVKYRLIVDDCGGWALLQELLHVLAGIAAKHLVGIGAVAIRWVLDRPGVAAVIVGARTLDHLSATLKAFAFALDDADRAAIGAVLAKRRGPGGDCFGLERVPGGPHAGIMKYNLNADPGTPHAAEVG